MSRRTYLVTGVSRGLGGVLAERLLDDGHRVLGLSRGGNGRVPEFEKRGTENFRHFTVELSEPAALREGLFQEIAEEKIALHGLVNNAAIALDDLVTNLDQTALEDMFRVNVFAAMELSRGFIRNCLLHRTAGSLVHISSVCAHTGYKGLSLYGATKGALEAFSKNIAREWGARGIRSNCIVCGFMETDMNASLDEDTRERIYRRTALGQPTDPHSVAAMAAYLLSGEAASVTGQALPVDGGTL